MLRIGVLALQGDFERHATAVTAAGGDARMVRTAADLDGVRGLVIPGGESTALLRLLDPALKHAITRFAVGGGVFGTCAGAILAATRVTPHQSSFGLIDMTVERNAYGRQRESFETPLEWDAALEPTLADVPGVFIRAPRITAIGPGVEVLARHRGDPVLVRSGRHMAATFHPELADHGASVHARFLARLDATPFSPAIQAQ